MLEQMGPGQVKILAKLAFGKAAALNAVTCGGEVVIWKFRARRYCKLATSRLPAFYPQSHFSDSPTIRQSG
jgi:hypothetical protein